MPPSKKQHWIPASHVASLSNLSDLVEEENHSALQQVQGLGRVQGSRMLRILLPAVGIVRGGMGKVQESGEFLQPLRVLLR